MKKAMNVLPMQGDFNRLLVVDDNEAIHNDFRKIFSVSTKGDALRALDAELFGTDLAPELSTVDYELSFASQGQNAFQLLKESMASGIRFGVAFVDMRMPPGWDGVETIENLWKVDPDLQVVICTAYSDRSWKEITQQLGLTDQLLILKKPFDEVEVVQLTASLTKKRELLAESQKRMEHLERVVVDQDAELKAAHRDAEHLISSITSALICMDESGVVTRWNPAAEEVFGLFRNEAIGTHFEALPITWTDVDELSAALQACTMVQQKQRELRFIDANGLLRILSATICPILNDPTTKARLILATDVTPQNELQTQADQTQHAAPLDLLTTNAALDINAPVKRIGDNVRAVAKSFDTLLPSLNSLSALG